MKTGLNLCQKGIFNDGKFGEAYNIGGFNELKNVDLIKDD